MKLSNTEYQHIQEGSAEARNDLIAENIDFTLEVLEAKYGLNFIETSAEDDHESLASLVNL